jgi:serine/threonine protein kinase
MLRGEKLGEGTFGIVYSGISPKSNKQYAVKRNLVEDETSFIGVPREVDVLNKLRHHPHVVRLEQVSFGQPFNNGCFSPLTGKDRISQRDDAIHFIFKQAAYDMHRFIYGAVITDFSLIKRYMVNILLGIEYMHSQKIIHRDLKPSNILIFGDERDAMGVGNIAKICDFGLAKPYTYQGTQTPSTVTSWYRAPEITLGYPHYDYKVDIWSIGCILYEMVAKRAFIPDVPDNNDNILSCILGALPQELPMRRFRELIRSNKWRKITLTSDHSPRIRRSFMQQIGLNIEGVEQFERQAGKLDLFCDLLDNMLRFEWDRRYTATQCLDHAFFNDYKSLITETRKQYPPIPKREQPLIIRKCVERRWMALAVTEIFNNRGSLRWYSTRALFQAMDLFDRYLSIMFHTTTIPPNAVESDIKGFIHDKSGAELRFMTCLYLCIKYFSSIHYPISYDSIVAEEYRTNEAKMIAEQFEGGFIKNCLAYDIYRPTVYEAADDFDDKLEDTDIRDLIILYSMNDSFSGMKPSELYHYYRTNLRGRPLELLFSPIIKPQAYIPSSSNSNPRKVIPSLDESTKISINNREKEQSSSSTAKHSILKPLFPLSTNMPKSINQSELLRPLVQR